MSSVIELSEQELRRKHNTKWSTYGANVVPAWVAEMDFAVARPIQTALDRLVADEDYGYAFRNGAPPEHLIGQAFARRMAARFGWTVAADRVVAVADLVQATIAVLVAFSEPGDGVVLQMPSYPPFQTSIASTGRRLIASRLRPDGGRYGFDRDELKASVDERTRILILCNPQNPTGRVFDRSELLAYCELAVERDLVILTDEIHADLIYDGRSHIPVGSLGPEIAERTLTITSATKGFNIPGLRCGAMHFGSAALQARFHQRVPERLLGAANIAGVMATVAAWDEGQPWLDDLVPVLQARRDHLLARFAAELPEARMLAPEATYLAWADFTALPLRQTAFRTFLDGGVALSPGEAFAPESGHFARLNFATSEHLLDTVIDRVVAAAKGLTRAAAE